ncbi:MAG: FAD binding domain-containing protein, partial [Desulfobacterales bacterium]|nr:FAD binding domain-containing protein [Desulfobacterales bacterium]
MQHDLTREDTALFELKEFKRAASLEQAHEWLLRDKKNTILGGNLWMRLGRQRFRTGIDLSGLDLNRIVETDSGIDIGCCTTLRQMETSPVLK